MELESMAKLLMGLRIASTIAGLVVLGGIIAFFVTWCVAIWINDWKWKRIRKRIEKGSK